MPNGKENTLEMKGGPSDASLEDTVLECMLPHVATFGWSKQALLQGTLDAGLDAIQQHQLFMGDPNNALEYYLGKLDREMEHNLQQLDLSSMRIKDRVASGVMIRLKKAGNHKKVADQTFRHLMNPMNVLIAQRSLCHTVSTIWHAIGDKSTDFNYYSKRFLLGGVYTATLIFWLKDDSEDATATRAFLNRRLDQVLVIPQVKQQIKNAFSLFIRPFKKQN